MQLFNVYNNIKAQSPNHIKLSYNQAMQALLSGDNLPLNHKDKIVQVRSLDKTKNPDKVRELKGTILTTTFNASAKNGRQLSFINALNTSDFFYFDIDGCKSVKEAEALRDELYNTGKVTAVWKSVSGYGVGGLLKLSWLKNVLPFGTDILNSTYQLYMNLVIKKLGLDHYTFDQAAFTLERCTILSYDEGMRYKLLPVDEIEEPSLIEFEAFQAAFAKPKSSVKVSAKPLSKRKAKPFNGVIEALNPLDKILLNALYKSLTTSTFMDQNRKELLGERMLKSIAGGNCDSFCLYFAKAAIKKNIAASQVISFLKGKLKNVNDFANLIANRIVRLYNKYEDTLKGLDLQTYLPTINNTGNVILAEGEYLDSIFDEAKFNTGDNEFPKYKVIINSPTGSGKNYAILNNVKENKTFTIIAVPSIPLIDSIAKEGKNFELKVGKFYGEVKEIENCDCIAVTYNSLPQLIKLLFKKNPVINRTALLVIDEFHTINYDGFKQKNFEAKQVFDDMIKVSSAFDKVICLTGTINSSMITSFDDAKIIDVKNEKKRFNTAFTYIKRNSTSTEVEDISIIKHYIDKGFYPVVFKQNKKETGWLGKVSGGLKENFGLNFAKLNADSKQSEEYESIIKNQVLDTTLYQGIFATSFVREGVSIKTLEPKKIVYIVFTPQDADTLEQISNRVRNAEEVLVVNVYNKNSETRKNNTGELIESPFSERSLNFNCKKAKALIKQEAELEAVKQEGLNRMFNKVFNFIVEEKEGTYLNKRSEISEVFCSQAFTLKRVRREIYSPYFIAWLGRERYSWAFTETFYESLPLVLDETKAVLKLKRKALKSNWEEALWDVRCDLVQEEIFNTGNRKYVQSTIVKALQNPEIDTVHKNVYNALNTVVKFLRMPKMYRSAAFDIDPIFSFIGSTGSDNKSQKELHQRIWFWNIEAQIKAGKISETQDGQFFAEAFEVLENWTKTEVSSQNDLIDNVDFSKLYEAYKGKNSYTKDIKTFEDFCKLFVKNFFELGERTRTRTDGKRTSLYHPTKSTFVEELEKNGFSFDLLEEEELPVQKVTKTFNFVK